MIARPRNFASASGLCRLPGARSCFTASSSVANISSGSTGTTVDTGSTRGGSEFREVFREDVLQYVAKERHSGLGMEVELPLGQVQEVMLSSVPESVDRLEDQRLLFRQERRVRQSLSDALVEPDGVWLSAFTDLASLCQNACLEQHFEGMIEEDQDRLAPAHFGDPVEMVDREQN